MARGGKIRERAIKIIASRSYMFSRREHLFVPRLASKHDESPTDAACERLALGNDFDLRLAQVLEKELALHYIEWI